MRSSSTSMATRARVLAVAVLATVVVAAAAASATADVAPAPGAMVAVPPPPPPPVMAPSEAAERFARSVVLESVGAEDGADEPAAAAAAAAPGASGGDGELLRWAISHSDPAALREAAKQARASSAASLEERQRRVAELREVVETSVVSEADMIKQAVAVVQGQLERRRGAGGGGGGIKAASGEEDSRSAALSALGSLADLAQSIDNANDLRPLGALAPLAALLEPPSAGGNGDSALRAAAGRCVGVAASNNAKFQADFLAAHPEAVAWLLQGLEGGATGDKLRLPLLFAASTFARSASAGSRDAFFAAGGIDTIGKLLRDGADSPALALNAAVLLGDLADLAAAGDDGGALVAAVGGAAAGEETWRALAEGVLETVGGRPLPAPAAMDKALSAVRALSGLESGRRALAAAGGAEALRVAGEAVVASGGGAKEYREYLSELAREIAEGLSSADGGGGRAEL
jgi:hypothetical protein